MFSYDFCNFSNCLHNLSFQTATGRGDVVTADTERDVKQRVARADVRATLSNKLDPGFWPARGRRSRSEDLPPLFRWDRLKSEAPWLYWQAEAPRKDGELRRDAVWTRSCTRRHSRENLKCHSVLFKQATALPTGNTVVPRSCRFSQSILTN
jgi:hypothetical protein